MQAALLAPRERGSVSEAEEIIATFAERQRLVDKPAFDALEQRYATARPT